MKRKRTEHAGPEAPADPSRKKRGALMVHERLREDIQWMRLTPGSALDEVSLAKEFEVSRTPIREALLLLASEGFVHFLQNRTSIVAPLSLHNQSAFLDTFILLSRGLIRAAALNGLATREQLAPFVDGFAEGLQKDDTENAFRAQLGLYREIAGLTKNRFLSRYFLEAQDASVRMKLLYYFPHLTAADKHKAIEGLAQVVEALLSGDAARSDRAVCETILFETVIIQRGLEPRYGHIMEVGTAIDAGEGSK